MKDWHPALSGVFVMSGKKMKIHCANIDDDQQLNKM